MPTFRTGIVRKVTSERPGVQQLTVDVDGDLRRAVLYARWAAPASVGDRVVLNTTAVELGLGSGGEDFVVWNLAREAYDAPSGGHIMKLRYTPGQADVLAVEAPESPHHLAVAHGLELGGTPVVAASLHSQLLPVVVGLRMRRPELRIAYVMTDGGALELTLSRTVTRLRDLGWLCGTVTTGHAVGGDLESVSIHSGLLAARAVHEADVVVAGMGPGVVGTGTPFGTTGLELGTTINAVAALGGRAVACVRMSEGDARDRHRGVSQHARIALERVALAAADVPVPAGSDPGPLGPHRVVEIDCEGVLEALEEASAAGLAASHMGRGPGDDALFFLAAAAAGIHASGMV